MQAIHDGQCGLCGHFGENHATNDALVSIVTSKQADVVFLDECGHPKLAVLHLQVTAMALSLRLQHKRKHLRGRYPDLGRATGTSSTKGHASLA